MNVMSNIVRSNSARERDLQYLVHQQVNLDDYARTGGVLMARGDGCYVIDDQGNRYLEAMSAMWCASLGFSEKRLAEVAYKQMLELPYYHTFNRGHLPSVDLAEKLVEIAPRVGDAEPLTRVLLQCSGSEANDTAIKLVWYYFNAIGRPQKKKIIGRWRGYHGNTVATTSLSGQPHMHRDFDLPVSDRFLHVANPHYYRYAQPGEGEEAFAERLASELEALIVAQGPDTIAAFFAEPVQGGGGAITPPATYFDRVQEILKKYEILFLVDEVICGFGRTGNMWGAETYGLKPDLLSCAKALSASYQPISALMLTDQIYQAMVSQSRTLGTFGHGFTYAGHPVACAVALETLKIYEQDKIVDRVRTLAPRMKAGLEALRDHPLVGDVRGVGMIFGVELVQDKKTRAPFDPKLKVGQRVLEECQKVGLIVRAIEDRIAFTPPLIITATQIDDMCEMFRKGLDAAWAGLKG
jgi:4-aminobutyrate--pyruvate transaminase